VYRFRIKISSSAQRRTQRGAIQHFQPHESILLAAQQKIFVCVYLLPPLDTIPEVGTLFATLTRHCVQNMR
jgi:hypothetical protein